MTRHATPLVLLLLVATVTASAPAAAAAPSLVAQAIQLDGSSHAAGEPMGPVVVGVRNAGDATSATAKVVLGIEGMYAPDLQCRDASDLERLPRGPNAVGKAYRWSLPALAPGASATFRLNPIALASTSWLPVTARWQPSPYVFALLVDSEARAPVPAEHLQTCSVGPAPLGRPWPDSNPLAVLRKLVAPGALAALETGSPRHRPGEGRRADDEREPAPRFVAQSASGSVRLVALPIQLDGTKQLPGDQMGPLTLRVRNEGDAPSAPCKAVLGIEGRCAPTLTCRDAVDLEPLPLAPQAMGKAYRWSLPALEPGARASFVFVPVAAPTTTRWPLMARWQASPYVFLFLVDSEGSSTRATWRAQSCCVGPAPAGRPWPDPDAVGALRALVAPGAVAALEPEVRPRNVVGGRHDRHLRRGAADAPPPTTSAAARPPTTSTEPLAPREHLFVAGAEERPAPTPRRAASAPAGPLVPQRHCAVTGALIDRSCFVDAGGWRLYLATPALAASVRRDPATYAWLVQLRGELPERSPRR